LIFKRGVSSFQKLVVVI